MQVPTLSDPPGAAWWLAVLRSPAALIVAFGATARWIVIPALTTLLRRDLKPELARLADHAERIPAVERDVKELQHDVSRFAEVPAILARIEENLRQLNLLAKEWNHASGRRSAAT